MTKKLQPPLLTSPTCLCVTRRQVKEEERLSPPLVGGVRGGGITPSELKGKQTMCIRVTVPTVEKELNTGNTPVLLACLHPDAEIRSQVAALEQVAARFGERVKVCLLCEAFIGAFGQTYGVEGTPTYLIIRDHRVIVRLLGQVDEPTLTGCINRTLACSS